MSVIFQNVNHNRDMMKKCAACAETMGITQNKLGLEGLKGKFRIFSKSSQITQVCLLIHMKYASRLFRCGH